MLLTASDVYISNFENVFDFEKTDNPKSVSVYGGSLNITNISGSVSNGGNWSIDSNVNISNCTGSGFTADFLGLYRDSSMTVSGWRLQAAHRLRRGARRGVLQVPRGDKGGRQCHDRV